jgi:hypothetical protein
LQIFLENYIANVLGAVDDKVSPIASVNKKKNSFSNTNLFWNQRKGGHEEDFSDVINNEKEDKKGCQQES